MTIVKAPPVKAPTKPFLRKDIFGWTEKNGENVQEFAPPPHGPCIVCAHPLGEPLVVQVVTPPHSNRQYFYRAHKVCWEGVGKREQLLYDQCLLNLLEKGAL